MQYPEATFHSFSLRELCLGGYNNEELTIIFLHIGVAIQCVSVTFCNTHSNFADIIQAEIFEPNLSNSIPTPSYIFVHFRILPTILTLSGTFSPVSPHSTCCPSTLPPITHSITLTLIVSNCLSSSCCIMIRDIHSLLCSFHLVLPSIVFILSCIPDFSFIEYLLLLKFPVSCMFPHSEYQTRLVFILLYLTLHI